MENGKTSLSFKLVRLLFDVVLTAIGTLLVLHVQCKIDTYEAAKIARYRAVGECARTGNCEGLALDDPWRRYALGSDEDSEKDP